MKLEYRSTAVDRMPITVLAFVGAIWSTVYWIIMSVSSPLTIRQPVLSAGMAWNLGHWLSLIGSVAFVAWLCSRFVGRALPWWSLFAAIGVYLLGHVALLLELVPNLASNGMYLLASQVDIYMWHAMLPVLVYQAALEESRGADAGVHAD